MVQINFDASTVAPDMGVGDPVPAGWYKLMADESDMKPTKDGAGAYLQIRFDIIDGQHKGRKVFTRLNLRNSNAQTVEIAYKQLSAIAHAVGVLQVQDSTQLHGIPLKGRVKIRKGDGQYEDQNEITAYKNINEDVGDGQAVAGAPPAMQMPPAQQPQQPQQQPGQQPWGQQPQGQGQAPAQPWQQPPQQQPQPQPQQQPWAQQPQGQAPAQPPQGQPQQPWQQPAQQQAPQQPQQQAPQPQQQHPAQSMTPPWSQPSS